jgi:beta-lactamase regulating signal transducer with metallopeptidase domain
VTILTASLVDAAIVLAVGLTAAALLRRRSAALRHAILGTAIGAASLMPAFELLLPQLPVIRWDAQAVVVSSGGMFTPESPVAGSSMNEAVTATGQGVAWARVLVIVWLFGAMATCAGLIGGLVRLWQLRSRCAPVTGRWRELTDELSRQCGVDRYVALLQSDDPSLLVTCGVLNPRIILPAGVSGWSEDRMRIVIRHELAHVRRHDAIMQVTGELLRVVHWINPLVWIACQRLRQESEYACDDAVLSAGVEPTEYATHLLDVARHLSARRAAWISAPAIARPSTLERRIVAMLHRHRHRAPVSRRGWSLAALVGLVLSIPLAAAGVAPVEPLAAGRPGPGDVTLRNTRSVASAPGRTAAAQTDTPALDSQVTLGGLVAATISGRVLDQSGGALPGTRLTLTSLQTGAELTAHADVAGRFAFRNLQPGRYELVASLVAFATVRNVLTLASGAAVERALTLPLGSIQETVTLACSAPGAAGMLSKAVRLQQRVTRAIGAGVLPVLSAQEPPAPAPIRVGGSVREPKKIRDVKPACPPTVRSGETPVRLTGRVGVDGFINDLTAVVGAPGGAPPTELTEAALEAVRQWRYTPTLLNGRAVEVNITVDVVFTRS